ncbi:MAG: hypothetical protein M3463_05160 [Verrucomicrobiota bacterium]|nr:hypothetical protein [Verrucomicrobiota bacterium]
MKVKPKKAAKAIRRSVRKAVKRHTIATGVVTGVATAVALSATGAARKLSDTVGSGIGNLLRARGQENGGLFKGLRYATGDALLRAGHFFHPETGAMSDEPRRTRRAASTSSDS